jgi:CPA2 family monovalent cation:H+ antiporter-2
VHLNFIENFLIIVLSILAASVIFRALRLPTILGYLVAGLIISPHALGSIEHIGFIQQLAEFGIVLLMFTIGLEFSLSQLVALRRSVCLLGGLQVILTITTTMGIAFLLNMTMVESIVIGCIVAMSSTAIVIKQLSDQLEIYSKHGLNSVGILLFQDLAVIPILIVIAYLSGTGEEPNLSTTTWSILKAATVISLMIIVGRWLLKPIFYFIAATRITELFMLIILFVAIGSAWLTHEVGISYALGAFLAGIMLGESQFRHQIHSEIRPFRDFLLGLFFVSIGMLINLKTWLDAWFWILLLFTALVLGKAILITLICRATKSNLMDAARTGIVLAQGGEFGFAILTLALSNHLISTEYGQVVLAALLLSFAFAPILIRYNKQIVSKLFPKSSKFSADEIKENISKACAELTDHVVICGYGRVGQNVSRFLGKVDQPYIGLDLDPEIIQKSILAGDIVVYGNATRLDILETAQLKKAAAVVITFEHVHPTLAILEQIRPQYPDLPILVRCKDEAEFKLLEEHKPSKIVAEVFEESLSLINHLLQIIHVPPNKISNLLTEARDKNFEILHQVFPGTIEEESTADSMIHEHLRPVLLTKNSHAINQSLKELSIDNVKVIHVKRAQEHFKPRGNTRFQQGDIIILYGLPVHLDEAERTLLM